MKAIRDSQMLLYRHLQCKSREKAPLGVMAVVILWPQPFSSYSTSAHMFHGIHKEMQITHKLDTCWIYNVFFSHFVHPVK